MSKRPEIDAVTGVETTGHEWDGIKELNKPLPRWWLLTFYASIIWAIGYMVAYPAWPTLTGYTKGVLGYSQRATLAEELKVANQAQSGLRGRLDKTPLADIAKDTDLLRFAQAGGATTFQTNCGPCHGRGAQGGVGYPNLNDDDWLWGGGLEDVQKTILYGVRSDHKLTRASQMPRYGLDNLLKVGDINDAAEHVLSLAGQPSDAPTAARGAMLFKEQCASCHGEGGRGNSELGAPNLADAIWLYGRTKPDIVQSIHTGRGGMMPSWVGRLDNVTIKALTVYVHTLGGGK